MDTIHVELKCDQYKYQIIYTYIKDIDETKLVGDIDNLYFICVKNNRYNSVIKLYDILSKDITFRQNTQFHSKTWGMSLTHSSYELIMFLHSKPEYSNFSLELEKIIYNKDKRLRNEMLEKIIKNDTYSVFYGQVGYIFTITVKSNFELAKQIYTKYHNDILPNQLDNALSNICKYYSVNQLEYMFSINKNIVLTKNHLLCACKNNYNNYNNTNNLVKYIIDKNTNLNNRKIINEALVCAIKNGCLEPIKYLITLNNNNKIKFAKFKNYFNIAIKHGNFLIAEYFVSTYPKYIHQMQIINYKHNPQMEYDCCINNETRNYITKLFGIKFKKIDPTHRYASIYCNDTFYSTWFIPDNTSKYWDMLPFILLEIPKNATCSISTCLKNKSDNIARHNCFGHLFAKTFPKSTWHKIKSISRNPYSRAVSAYFFAKRGGFFDNIEYTMINATYDTFEDWVLNGLTKQMTKLSNKAWWAEIFVAQIEYIIDDDRNIIVDMNNIGRFENLEQDCKRLFNLNKLPHENSSSHDNYTSYYTNQLVIDKIYELYKEDFDTFGYNQKL
jgi:hypothetical protein